MKRIGRILVVLLLVGFFGCRDMNVLLPRSEVLARVGDKELVMDDMKNIFSPGTNPEDSIKLLESYVDMWVKKQLKTMEAEIRFSADEEDIQRMVDEYRSSLLNNKLDHFWISSGIDSVFTDGAVAEYYHAHLSDFKLDRPIVKGSIVVVPDNFRNRAKLKELIGGNASQREDFKVMSEKSGLKLYEYTTWTDVDLFFSHIPSSEQKDMTYLLSSKGVADVVEGQMHYLIYISDVRRDGEVAPLERVSDLVLRILYNQRKGVIIRHNEDSLYNAALQEKNIIEININ